MTEAERMAHGIDAELALESVAEKRKALDRSLIGCDWEPENPTVTSVREE